MRAHLVDGGGHHAGQRGEADAETVGEGDHARHVHTEGLHQRGVLGGRAQVGAELGAFDDEPRGQAHDERGRHHPAAVVGQEHEAQVLRAHELRRNGVGLARGAVLVPEQALDDQRNAEGEQQAVEVVQLVQPLEHEALDQHAGDADHDGRDQQRPPVADAQLVEQQPGHEGAHHVLGAVREVDDVEQTEDHGQPQREQGVERAVDQPDQQLPEQGRGGNAEDLGHALDILSLTSPGGTRRP